ncbi:MAG: hypothetical protein MUC92_02960 [Fimbriimonadaceae bacterium]|jgi:flagellar M-ring protein FliF|nr:hypothetical protein [Fimbriimonadaceae bacterium]
MGSFLERIKQWWETADRTQRLVTVFGSLFLVVVLGATFLLSSQPRLQPVMTGLSESDKGTVHEELTKAGFKVELNQQGDVVVPSKDVQRARMVLATKGKLPRSGSSSMDIVTGIGSFDTLNQEQRKLLIAQENAIAETITALEGVGGAMVKIAPGKNSPVMDEKVPPTAVVTVTESVPGAITREKGQAIANLIQYAITGMTPEGVSVVLNSGRVIYNGAEQNQDGGMANSKMEAERTESKRRTQTLQAELDSVFGVGNTIAYVEVNLNMDPTTTSVEDVKPSEAPLREETGKEGLQSRGATIGGVAGLESNTPGQPATPGSGGATGNTYNNQVISRTYGATTTRKETKKALGEISAMNVTVTANSKLITDVGSLQRRVEAVLGDKLGTPGFTASVVPIEFSTNAAQTEAKALADAASSQRMQQILAILPVAALILVGLMLVKSIGKTFRTQAVQTAQLSNGQLVHMPVRDDHHAVTYAEASTSLESIESQDDDPGHDEETKQIMAALGLDPGIDYPEDSEEALHIRSIKTKVDVPLEQIKRMAREKPEVTAMLLKSWMMEERR